MSILNVAAYRFVELHDLPVWQAKFREYCQAQALKGSIVLSCEGINLMLASTPEKIAQFKAYIEQFEPFKGLEYKASHSETVPFKRMFVKIKAALTPLQASVTPGEGNHLPSHLLKQWFDENKAFTLIDVRNDYELEAGMFERTTSLNLKHFSDFAQAIKQLPEALRSQPIVTCCTGGIRCEKVVPYMQAQGFKEVYQLEGGILQYLHDCGDAHFKGACYVFDERVAINKADII